MSQTTIARLIAERDEAIRSAEIDRDLALVRQKAFTRAVEERDEANAALARVWKALGIDSYVGKEISECVADFRADAIEAAARVVEHYPLPTIPSSSMWLIDKAAIAAEIRGLASNPEVIRNAQN